MVSASLGGEVVSAQPLAGGGFAAVWRATLADGRDVVLKVGPEPGVALLEYEDGLIAAEATYLRLVGSAAPVATVLFADDDRVITTFLPGIPLTDLDAPADQVRHDLGAAVARIHRITGTVFGYTGSRPHADSWPAAFAEIMESLLRDGQRWGVEVPAGRIRGAIARCEPDLRRVTVPALVHFDLWDGNVLAAVDTTGRAALSGLVDGERYLFGDPLVDFVSPAVGARLDELPDHPFRVGYGPVEFDPPARRRLALYRLHLAVLMLIEMPSRGMTEPGDEPRRTWVTGQIADELDHIDELLAAA